jgi:hypothetical protein
MLATRAFRRYTELFEELSRRRKLGPITGELESRFNAAMQTCWDGMGPDEREEVETFVQKAAAEIKAAQNQVSFTVDTSKAPYTVPCPVCNAYALDACHSKPRSRIPGIRWPADARVLPSPHPERQTHWEKHPEWRVRAM